jgi:hypothetical protein
MKRSSGPRKTANLSESLQNRLNMYALAASAVGVGVLALSQPAEAKIIYTPAHAKLVEDHPIALDLNHDRIVDFYLIQLATADFDFASFLSACQHLRTASTGGLFCSSTLGMNAIRATDSKGNLYAAALRYGKAIQQGQRFAKRKVRLGGVVTNFESTTTWLGPWLNGGKGVKNRYLGLKFKIKGQFHFGWARITTTTSKDRYTTTLTGYAYETIPGKGIIAGQKKGQGETQGPSLGALAAGANALHTWK